MDENKELRELLDKVEARGGYTFIPGGSLPWVNQYVQPVLKKLTLRRSDFYEFKGKFGLRHFGHMKFKNAAGAQWESESNKVGRVDLMNNQDYCMFRSVAKIRGVDGVIEEHSATKHIDLAVVSDKNGQIRANLEERCESGSQTRAIRNMMLIDTVFEADENDRKNPACLNSIFYIVRFILKTSNPAVEEAFLDQFRRANREIYGIDREPASRERLPEPGLKDVTPKEEEPNSQLVDFQNLSFGEKIKTIEDQVKSSGYKKFDEDMKSNGASELKDWDDEQLVKYFVYLMGESKK